VLRETVGDFEGVRAAFGLVEIPEGAPLTITTNGVAGRTTNPDPADDWQASLAADLGTFYRSIAFED
jgi:hypothetical protein